MHLVFHGLKTLNHQNLKKQQINYLENQNQQPDKANKSRQQKLNMKCTQTQSSTTT